MSDKRRGLGRGLGALIPSSGPATTTRGGLATIPPAMRTGGRPVDLFFDQRPEPVEVPDDEREERIDDLAVAAPVEAPADPPARGPRARGR